QDFQQTIYRGRRYRKRIEEVIRYSNKTVTVSGKLMRIAEVKLGIDPKKISVIANGIDPGELSLKKSGAGGRYEGRTVILSVSHLERIKGLDLNIRAISHLKDRFPDLYYLIIGEGEERDALELLVKDLHLEDRVEFLGELPHHEAMEYMSCCDIFSLPSWNEGFGVVYLEAMGHGKPVIGCRGEGIDGTVRDRETGMLAEPRSVESLADSMDYLLSNRAEADRIGMNAKKLVLENYTWEKSAQTLLALYGKITGGNQQEIRNDNGV
ncbi:MAG TPA: glycosyltransferase, partial [Spirochaetia bacterium]|nr:glycosyltransferase [Spirochaetia bacterium]